MFLPIGEIRENVLNSVLCDKTNKVGITIYA
jgi:hypothetical protein